MQEVPRTTLPRVRRLHLRWAERAGLAACLFPEQETRTAFIPDREPLGEGVVTFGLVLDVDAEGLLTVPAVFAGTPEALSVPYAPCHSSFSVRVQPV